MGCQPWHNTITMITWPHGPECYRQPLARRQRRLALTAAAAGLALGWVLALRLGAPPGLWSLGGLLAGVSAVVVGTRRAVTVGESGLTEHFRLAPRRRLGWGEAADLSYDDLGATLLAVDGRRGVRLAEPLRAWSELAEKLAHALGPPETEDGRPALGVARIEQWLGVEPGGELRLRSTMAGRWQVAQFLCCATALWTLGIWLADRPFDPLWRDLGVGGTMLLTIPLGRWFDHRIVGLMGDGRTVLLADGRGLRVRDAAGGLWRPWGRLRALEPRPGGWRLRSQGQAVALDAGWPGVERVVATIEQVLAARRAGVGAPLDEPLSGRALSRLGPAAETRGQLVRVSLD